MGLVQNMRFATECPYELLVGADLPYLATGRLGLDFLLGNDPSVVDTFEIYVESSTQKQWQRYLIDQGARLTGEGPDIKIFVVPSLKPVQNSHKAVNIETLAQDIGYMCPRYFNSRREEVQRKIPELHSRVTSLAPF